MTDDPPRPTADLLGLLGLHRRAMACSSSTVELVGEEDWGRPTPCEGWRLRDLVVHMIADNRGFAVAARGERSDRSAWEPERVDEPLHAAYRAAAADVILAFNAPTLAELFWLPRIDEAVTFPAARAIGFHLLDYAVHAWDVGVSIGRPVDLPADVVRVSLEIAHRDVPDGPRRHRDGAGFRPAVAVDSDASAQNRLIGFLGRDPGWRGERS